MHRYRVYGRCLASEIEFPQLLPTHADHDDWILRLGETPPALDQAKVVGEDLIANVPCRLIKHSLGYRAEFDDTGIFDVSADGRNLRWYPGTSVDWEVLCADVTGRVLAVTMHMWGKLILHGSAVVLGEEGVAFLAPKGYGKSTMSMALTAAGGRLASDDIVTVEPHPPVMAWPGLGSLRLIPDTAKALRVDHLASPGEIGLKSTITQLPEEKLVWEQFPLTAIYLLAPVNELPGSDAVVERIRLDPLAGVLALVPNTKLGSLLGQMEAAVVLQRAASVTSAIPVYTLRVVRDLDRLPELADQLFAWHNAVSNPPVPEAVL
jgi:hypothetical protein